MVNYFLTGDFSNPDYDFDFVQIPKPLANLLFSWIHEEVPHDFFVMDLDAELDVDVNIDLVKFKKALLRTFVKDYNMEYLKEHDL